MNKHIFLNLVLRTLQDILNIIPVIFIRAGSYLGDQ